VSSFEACCLAIVLSKAAPFLGKIILVSMPQSCYY
jgi:hypothetical protein